ncbi:MAG: FtsX-like permease family protein [Bacteroidales bacterium]|jgi:ABC-type lipoprotein release transport system permease subunit|nr:FtsX-like permease family protein [Bacteroidales bacterium]
MKDYQLAWRNLWRNRRRTLITAASVFFAVFFALIMRSFQLGTYEKMYRDVIESYSGYLQLQHVDYMDESNLDNSFVIDPGIISRIEDDPNVTAVIPKLESFALAAAGSRTQAVMVIGMDPDNEIRGLNIRNRLIRYRLTPGAVESLKAENLPGLTPKLLDVFVNESFTDEESLISILGIDRSDTLKILPLLRKYTVFDNGYLTAADTGFAVIGSGLSEYIHAGVGDTLVLMGQGFHGASAAGLYVIKGIVNMSQPEIDNRFVYLTLDDARYLYAAPGMATSAIISVRETDDDNLLMTRDRLREVLGDDLVIRTWKEMNALLLNQMEADNKSGAIMIGILYLVIAFGVFGTVLMMMAERRREFGMLVSIGMRKGKLARTISMEMLLIGLLGVAAGVAGSLPVVFLGYARPLRFTGEMAKMYEDYGFDPVMPMLLPDTYYLWQVVIVLLILLVAIAFSVRKVFKLNVINALRA